MNEKIYSFVLTELGEICCFFDISFNNKIQILSDSAFSSHDELFDRFLTKMDKIESIMFRL